MKKLLISAITVLLSAIVMFVSPSAAFAVEADLDVQVESLAVIATATGGHIAGNTEIKMISPMTLPPTIKCDRTYVTTKKTTDPDGAMRSLLQQAVVSGRPVRLRVTDDPALTAYPGRCSFQIVEVKKA